MPVSKEKTVYRSYFTFNGQKYERKSLISQRDADRKADTYKAELERGEVSVNSKMSVKKWANDWLEVYKRPSVGEGSYKNYRTHINLIVDAIGNQRLCDVKDIQLQGILNKRAGKSKSDLLKLRMTIQAVFKRARRSRLIVTDPAEFLEIPVAEDNKRRSITEREREYILALAERHHAGLWVKTLLYCGIRPGESRALDWRHIDFNKKRLKVEKAMKARTVEIGKPKTAAGVREIPIPDVLFTEFLARKGEPFSPVFTQPTTGLRHTEESMRCLWENFKRELNISMGAKLYRNKITIHAVADDLVPYCLRHTYGTDLQDAGVPINVARYLMGHESILVTSQVYTDTTDTTIDDAASRINNAIKTKIAEINDETVIEKALSEL